jgi:hypothetical protein
MHIPSETRMICFGVRVGLGLGLGFGLK